MLIMYLGIFTLSIIILWGLFIVAKIHSYKFKNFSNHIKTVTTFLTIFLIILTIIGYMVIIFSTSNTVKIDNYSGYDTKEINY